MASHLSVLRLGCVGLVAACAAEAADYVKPDIKPGLWEVTSVPQVSGEMPIPEEQLQKMTPEQRARVQAAMQSSMGSARKPRVYKECMTPDKIARGLDLDKGATDASCKRTILASTPSELKLHDECSRPNGKSVTDVHFQVEGTTRMTGKVNIVMSSGGKSMTVNSSLSGKWLGADCGGIKDTEVQK
jgi:hypothetical protein